MPARAAGAGATHEKVQSDAEFDIPPASLCARCGSALCDGCVAPAQPTGAAAIAWESPGPLFRRFWATARASAVMPKQVFGQLGEGSVLQACYFALLVELTALASVAALLTGAGALLFPELALAVALEILADATLSWLVLLAVPALAILMVILHASWGVALELGVRLVGVVWRPSRGLRFALYSCGWDLLTSPAGLLFGTLNGGIARAWQETLRAARVPREAMDAYLTGSRALSPERSRRARRWVLSLMAVPMLLGIFSAAFLAAGALWRIL